MIEVYNCINKSVSAAPKEHLNGLKNRQFENQMNMNVLWRILFVAITAGYFLSSLGAFASKGTESNLDENKSRLIRGRRDENGLRLDSFDGMSIKEEKPSNDYSTLYEYPSLDMESPVSQDSSSDEIKTKSEIQDPLLGGKMIFT